MHRIHRARLLFVLADRLSTDAGDSLNPQIPPLGPSVRIGAGSPSGATTSLSRVLDRACQISSGFRSRSAACALLSAACLAAYISACSSASRSTGGSLPREQADRLQDCRAASLGHLRGVELTPSGRPTPISLCHIRCTVYHDRVYDVSIQLSYTLLWSPKVEK